MNKRTVELVKNKVGKKLYSELVKQGFETLDLDIINGNYVPRSRFNEVLGKDKNEHKILNDKTISTFINKTLNLAYKKYCIEADILLPSHLYQCLGEDLVHISSQFMFDSNCKPDLPSLQWELDELGKYDEINFDFNIMDSLVLKDFIFGLVKKRAELMNKEFMYQLCNNVFIVNIESLGSIADDLETTFGCYAQSKWNNSNKILFVKDSLPNKDFEGVRALKEVRIIKVPERFMYDSFEITNINYKPIGNVVDFILVPEDYIYSIMKIDVNVRKLIENANKSINRAEVVLSHDLFLKSEIPYIYIVVKNEINKLGDENENVD
jgi:hypothetical protein